MTRLQPLYIAVNRCLSDFCEQVACLCPAMAGRSLLLATSSKPLLNLASASAFIFALVTLLISYSIS